MDFSNMVIVRSYVRLPEGNRRGTLLVLQGSQHSESGTICSSKASAMSHLRPTAVTAPWAIAWEHGEFCEGFAIVY